MANFKYSAVGSDGRTIRGSLDASSREECVDELRRRHLTPLQIDSKRGLGGRVTSRAVAKKPGAAPARTPSSRVKKGSILSMDLGGTKPGVRKQEEAVIFTRQLSTMIGAGIPLLECLEILQEQA